MARGQYICPLLSIGREEEVPCVAERCKLNFKTKKDTNNCSLKIMAASLIAIAQKQSGKEQIPTENIDQEKEETEG